MNIALLGFGVVGRGVYDLVADREDIRVSHVLCLEDIQLPDARVCHDYREITGDPSVDTVVECMGGLHPAFDFVKAAIQAGKNVVTSNKALVATFYDELLPLVQEKNVLFRCTAAVGGGIGWLSEIERSRRAQKIQGVWGIMNGTCNYILDNMTRGGLDYGQALKQAQALGYAEANPSTDVEGIDTWHKIILSANIAFGVSLDKTTVPVCGIHTISGKDVALFREKGYVCKLLGTARQTGDGICAYVQPTLVKLGEPESAVPMNFNLISFQGSASGRMSFYGQGAGRYPTAYNVVQDCVDLLRGHGFYAPWGGRAEACNEEDAMCYYIRGGQWPAGDTQETWGDGILTKKISVAKLHAWKKENPEAFVAGVME